jgi:hypothetical protein
MKGQMMAGGLHVEHVVSEMGMMSRVTRAFLTTVATISIGMFAAGCGDDEGENESGASAGGTKTACVADAATGETGLPAAFPIPGELTVTEVRKDGPTNVVDGYWSAAIDEAYPEYLEQVEAAGYEILFSEQEEFDAEISYRAGDRSGLIALRADCSEDDTTRVHITNRPA